MIVLHVLLTSYVEKLKARISAEGDLDRGPFSLEQVIIALGLFLLAVALVAGITVAFNARLAGIV